MRAVDLLVVPTTSQEPAALSLMEGMAMGRPLVASRTGGTPELIVDGETGLIFPPGDAAALAGQVVALLGDPERRRRMGEAGRARMEREFTVEKHVAGMLDLYERASARAGLRRRSTRARADQRAAGRRRGASLLEPLQPRGDLGLVGRDRQRRRRPRRSPAAVRPARAGIGST